MATFDWATAFGGGLNYVAFIPTPENCWTDAVGGANAQEGELVVAVSDRSGNALHATNGLGTLRRDGSYWYLETGQNAFETVNIPGLHAEYWCAAAGRIVTGDGDTGHINHFFGYNTATQRAGIGLRTSGTRTADMQLRNGSSLRSVEGQVLPLNANFIIDGGYQDGDLYIRHDGFEEGRSTTAPDGATFSRPIAFLAGQSTGERFYGGVYVIGTPTAAEKEAALDELARLTGVTLQGPVAAGLLEPQALRADQGALVIPPETILADFSYIEGTNFSVSVSGFGATWDDVTGLTIPDTPITSGATVTVTVTNPRGSAQSSFNVDVIDIYNIANWYPGGRVGVATDLFDAATLWLDGARSQPIVPGQNGQIVRAIDDASGNGLNSINCFCEYQTDGTLHWLYFNGSSHYIEFPDVPFVNGQFMALALAVRRLEAGDGMIVEHGTNYNSDDTFSALFTAAGNLRYGTKRTGASLYSLHDVPVAVGEDVALIARTDRQLALLPAERIETGGVAVPNTRDDNAASPWNLPSNRHIFIGSRAGSSLWNEMRLYFFALVEADLTEADLDDGGNLAHELMGGAIPGPFQFIEFTATATGPTTAAFDIGGLKEGDTYHWYINQGAAPSIPDLKAGTGAIEFGSFTIPVGIPYLITDLPDALTAATSYDAHLVRVRDGIDSDVLTSSFTTEASDGVAPVLSNPGFQVIDTNTVRVSVDTTEGRGLLYAVVTGSATQPTDAQIEAGQDHTGAAVAGNLSRTVAVDTAGTQTVEFTGLAATPQYAHFFQRDPTGNPSNVVSTLVFTPADVTPPVLTSAEVALDGADGFVGSFNTDTAEGVADIILTTSQTTPSEDDIENGVGAAFFIQDQAVTTTGPQAISGTGLAPGTYWAHAIHTDAAGNRSAAITSSNSFTVV